jgi:hypothetical protein
VAIGLRAGQDNQGDDSVAVGLSAGRSGQGNTAVAIGGGAGSAFQKNDSVAIGGAAGFYSQGTGAIAIGKYAGRTNQEANSIILNASGVDLSSNGENSFVVNPIRGEDWGNEVGYLHYDTATSEITYRTTAKSFIIDHPVEDDKYLVHGCLEGPEAGVYYRGQAEIEENSEYVEVKLPTYVSELASGFTVQLTQIYDEKCVISTPLRSTIPEDNMFKVYGKGKFFWAVHGKRLDVNVEPLKKSTKVYGNGPYKWM